MDRAKMNLQVNSEYVKTRNSRNYIKATEDIDKRKLMWAGHIWSKEGSLLRTVQENAP